MILKYPVRQDVALEETVCRAEQYRGAEVWKVSVYYKITSPLVVGSVSHHEFHLVMTAQPADVIHVCGLSSAASGRFDVHNSDCIVRDHRDIETAVGLHQDELVGFAA